MVIFMEINDMFGRIEEIKGIHDALKRVSYNTWLVLDLDKTVMESKLDLGGDQWFTSLMSHAVLSEPDKDLAFMSVIAIYHAVQAYIRAQVVEPEIITVIRALQDIGIPVLALTARDECIGASTIRQLKDIGIDFSRHPIALRDGTSFKQGIIFCNGANKGEALRTFFAECKGRPQHVVMLDDREKHLLNVKHVVEELGIRFDGLRYGYLDEKVELFDREKASYQLAHLKERLPFEVQATIDRLHLISDDMAAAIIPSQFSHGFFDKDPTDHASIDRERRDAEARITLA